MSGLFIFVGQMKKILVFIVLMIYFTVSSGFVVSFHFCMDELASTQIGSSSSEECGECGMHMEDNHCCWDDVKVLKLKTDHFSSQFKIQLFTPALPEQQVVQFVTTPFFNFQHDDGRVDDKPPLNGQDTYLQNRVFRI